ncbi:TPA: hypothetical protein ACMDOB_003313 [Vibrio metschnikovii]|uniref:hypothetical protein n=1 Tax=Vibrio TaxID=662 RepID=UPI002095A099|nr:hypothetical protein [Vibrio paracholerae]MCO7013837.1 hypothetical protein [Vibrio paracholerae]MCO7034590.1 hypothetical protein [Vibrio paracholerae]MCO7048021.1 hypothetical protein [Vibrio paracholerae]
MNFVIKTRKLTENDLGRDCPFPVLDQDRYEEQLELLAEDFKAIKGINSSSVVGAEIHIDSSYSEQELLNNLKHLFQRDFCIVRFQSIESLA